ncbi:MAG: phage terminase large subunit [Alphaproteobacteria bacterium]
MTHWFERLLKADFTTFTGKTLMTVNPGALFMPNWHIDLIGEYLEAVRRGEIKRLIINMPPRALKSTCVTVAWPAWLLGHDPKCRIIAASYSSSLAIKHSLDTRLVMESSWYKTIFPNTRLVRGQNEKRKFVTTGRGYRFATSVGGSTTGEGGNILIMDDPMNPLQAMSAAKRERVAEWYSHTFATRLDDKRKGAIVLVMQRLHQDDLSGVLLARGGWEHLCLPAIATEDRIYDFGRMQKTMKEGEMMHPLREDQEIIERAKAELGSSVFAAQYQQQPVPQEGRMVRPWWFERYKELPEKIDRVVQSWDTAIKSGQGNDASVCITFGESEGKSYVLDVAVMRVEYPELKKAVINMAELWHPESILIEDKASGQQLLQDMRREFTLPVIGANPKGDKITRFAAVSAMCEAGKVMLPKRAPWLAAFEEELFSFPEGKNDDQVDAFSQYLDALRSLKKYPYIIRKI